IGDLAYRGTLGRRDMDLAFPAFRVVHVAILGRDIHVAEHGEVWYLDFLQPARELAVPTQLVRVFRSTRRFAVRRVEAHDAHAIDGSSNAALRIVDEVRYAMRYLGDRGAREDRDTVVGLLPAIHGFIPRAAQFSDGEIRVLGLGFLQAGDVGLG